MSVAVAPGSLKVCLASLQTFQRIFDALIWLSCLAVHIYKILSTVVHEPVGATTCCGAIVLRCITNNISSTIGTMDSGTVGSAHHSLSLAVTVPVVCHYVLLVVLEVTHVRTAVDPPQTSTVKFEHFKDTIFSVIAITRITCQFLACVVELHEYLQLTVAVNVGAAGIVGHQRACDVLMYELYLLIARCPYRYGRALSLLRTTYHGRNGILVDKCS